jgi:hypothetical protein
MHTTHALSPKVWQRHLRYSSETPTFYQNYFAMSDTADVTGGKPIAVWSQSISGVSAINPSPFMTSMEERLLFFYSLFLFVFLFSIKEKINKQQKKKVAILFAPLLSAG